MYFLFLFFYTFFSCFWNLNTKRIASGVLVTRKGGVAKELNVLTRPQNQQPGGKEPGGHFRQRSLLEENQLVLVNICYAITYTPQRKKRSCFMRSWWPDSTPAIRILSRPLSIFPTGLAVADTCRPINLFPFLTLQRRTSSRYDVPKLHMYLLARVLIRHLAKYASWILSHQDLSAHGLLLDTSKSTPPSSHQYVRDQGS